MLPYSLQLIRLQQQGMKTKKHGNKIISNDIINVKFRQKVSNAKDIIKIVDNKILTLTSDQEKYGDKLIEYAEFLQDKVDEGNWQEISQEKLRTKLYTEGFTLSIDNKKIEYVVYSRTSSKSRTGQVLFIKKNLRDKMIKWQRLKMNLEGRKDVDYPSLLSYESLTSSSIETVSYTHLTLPTKA